jgi:hypothetical protein
MYYVQVHQSLVTHPKTFKLARLASLDVFAVVGRLVALWCWALDEAPEGRIDAACVDLVATATMWRGDADQWVGWLVQAGFLDAVEGGFQIHDWEDYAGRLMASREANRDRQRAFRANHHNGDVTVTSRTYNGAVSRTHNGASKRSEA